MQTYNPYSIVVIPFPFTDSNKVKNRPAVVISSIQFQFYTHHISLLMVTSVAHSSWYGDHKILDLKSTGLTTQSIIRQKIFTIDIRLVKKQVGHLAIKDQENVMKIMHQHLDFS